MNFPEMLKDEVGQSVAHPSMTQAQHVHPATAKVQRRNA